MGILELIFGKKKKISKTIFIRYNGKMISLQVVAETSLYHILKMSVEFFWKKYSIQFTKPENLYLVTFNSALTDLGKTIKSYEMRDKEIFDLRFRMR